MKDDEEEMKKKYYLNISSVTVDSNHIKVLHILEEEEVPLCLLLHVSFF